MCCYSRCHRKLPQPTHIDYGKDKEHTTGHGGGSSGGHKDGSKGGSKGHTETVVDKTEDVFR